MLKKYDLVLTVESPCGELVGTKDIEVEAITDISAIQAAWKKVADELANHFQYSINFKN